MKIVEPHLVRAKGCVYEAELKFDRSQVSIEAAKGQEARYLSVIRPRHL